MADAGTQVRENSDRQFPGYPEGYVFAHFADRSTADEAVERITALGFSPDDIVRYAGHQGAEIIDSEGTNHGLGAMISRAIEWVVSDEDHLALYEEKAREGGTVLGVHAPDEALRTRAVDVLLDLDATNVKHFGRLQVEVIRR